jgi:phospholipid/cholesterol/gamma-HCH transport system substrate-binding protein
VKIPEGSAFLLGSEGMMGSMYIDIDPPQDAKAGGFLAPGATAQGSPGASMNDFMASASGVMQKLEVMADAVNVVFGDKDVQSSIISTVKNTKEITSNISELTRAFADVAVQNKADLYQIIRELSGMATNMNQVAARMNAMLLAIDNNGQTGAQVVSTLKNLQKASENIAKVTKDIEGLTGDPKAQADVRETLQNAKEASERANRMLGALGGLEKEFAFDFKYGSKPDIYRAGASLKINYAPKSFLLMGVAGVGRENDIDLQIGRGSRGAAIRGGLVLGEPGAGVDYSPLKWLRFFADAYDPNDFKVRIGGEIRLGEKFSLVGESLNVRKKADNTTYVGIRGYF